jgi:hypothetical protein
LAGKIYFAKERGPLFIGENFKRTNLFCSAKKLVCSVNFFPAKIFSGILEKGNFSKQKKFGGKKINRAKRLFDFK